MKICVIGLGYIGLPTAAAFARAGAQVVGVDRNPAIVAALNRGEILIEEEGLESWVREAVEAGRLQAKEEPEAADAFIIAVPTPLNEDKKADLTCVKEAAASLLPYLQRGNTVILESTSPPGTVEEVLAPLLEQGGLQAGRDFYLGHSPERVIPGKILSELVANDRIAGGIDGASARKIADLYRLFVQGSIYETDARTAELCKLAENTYRDVNIAFANELARICEELGVDAWELIRLCNRHPRVHIHTPGPGVGGHCIAVDPWFIAEKAPEQARLIALSRRTNDGIPQLLASRVMELLAGIQQPVVALLGIAYKADVGDLRESPLLALADLLKAEGVTVRFHDPHASMAGNLARAEEAAAGSDLLILGVNHRAFDPLDYGRLASVMRRKILLDTRNALDPSAAKAAGFQLHSLGKP